MKKHQSEGGASNPAEMSSLPSLDELGARTDRLRKKLSNIDQDYRLAQTEELALFRALRRAGEGRDISMQQAPDHAVSELPPPPLVVLLSPAPRHAA